MARCETIQITYGGRAYNGAFRVEGDVVSVESAYGSRSVDLKGRSIPREMAIEVFREIVHRWKPVGAPKRKKPGPSRS